MEQQFGSELFTWTSFGLTSISLMCLHIQFPALTENLI